MLRFPLLHHPDGSDPALLEWIRHAFDSVLGWGPAAWVAVTGGVILAIPLGILAAYWRSARGRRMAGR